jgi:hypothetical protein
MCSTHLADARTSRERTVPPLLGCFEVGIAVARLDLPGQLVREVPRVRRGRTSEECSGAGRRPQHGGTRTGAYTISDERLQGRSLVLEVQVRRARAK